MFKGGTHDCKINSMHEDKVLRGRLVGGSPTHYLAWREAYVEGADEGFHGNNGSK